ncbi:MAG TPA: ester cyclase, partial [Vicinamibacterales bacterium]|nr:ester cyclase [Vicinamibacterales bacterium]
GFEAAELISGIAGYKQHFETITTAFPDLRITIEVLMAEDNREAARWLVEATHTGRLGDIPPSGKRVSMTGIAIIRTRNDQIVEEHANSDALGLLTQIGITPESVNVPPLFF